MAKGNDTPHDRIAHQVTVIIRSVQAKFSYQNNPSIIHASHGDFSDGLRDIVTRELLMAQHEILKIPYSKWEAERRRIAKELAKLDGQASD